MAIPVKGVPVALGLMGTGAAEGTVTIADARTIGVDMISLHSDMLSWEKGNRAFLSHFAPTENKANYVRVISRVFLAGRFNVSVNSSETLSGAGSGGADKPVNLLVPKAGDNTEKGTLQAYQENVNSLNAMLTDALKKVAVEGTDKLLPGGTVKVVSASARSVSLAETFARPLAVGYLGFDMAIGPGGTLGAPIPTHAVLEYGLSPSEGGSTRLFATAAMTFAYAELTRQAEDARAKEYVDELNELSALVPGRWPCNLFGFDTATGPLKVQAEAGTSLGQQSGDFLAVTRYRSALIDSIEELRRTMGNPALQVDGFHPRDQRAEDYLAAQLAANASALAQFDAEFNQHSALLRRAVNYAIRP